MPSIRLVKNSKINCLFAAAKCGAAGKDGMASINVRCRLFIVEALSVKSGFCFAPDALYGVYAVDAVVCDRQDF